MKNDGTRKGYTAGMWLPSDIFFDGVDWLDENLLNTPPVPRIGKKRAESSSVGAQAARRQRHQAPERVLVPRMRGLARGPQQTPIP